MSVFVNKKHINILVVQKIKDINKSGIVFNC